MTDVYVVRGENSGEPESYFCGLYPTMELAERRCRQLEDGLSFEFVWYDVVKVGPEGADCMLCNR